MTDKYTEEIHSNVRNSKTWSRTAQNKPPTRKYLLLFSFGFTSQIVSITPGRHDRWHVDTQHCHCPSFPIPPRV